MTATVPDEDWSDLDTSPSEYRETNTMPRTGTSRTSSSTGSPRRARRGSKRLEDLQKALSQQMFTAGGMISLGLPVTGTYMCQQAEVFPDAIIELARTRSDWIDALEKVASVGPGITVGRTVLGIAAAMGADRYHRSGGQSGFDPDKRACQFLGVTAAYYAVYKEGLEDNASGNYTPPPYGVFQPVA